MSLFSGGLSSCDARHKSGTQSRIVDRFSISAQITHLFCLNSTAYIHSLTRGFPVAFAPVVSYAQSMELLSHDELVRLTPPERLTLISQLWDSLEDRHLPLTAAQRRELDRRLRTPDEDRREGITWQL